MAPRWRPLPARFAAAQATMRAPPEIYTGQAGFERQASARVHRARAWPSICGPLAFDFCASLARGTGKGGGGLAHSIIAVIVAQSPAIAAFRNSRRCRTIIETSKKIAQHDRTEQI